MKNLLNPADSAALSQRLKALHPDSIRKWGKLTILEVLPHMTEPLRLAIGEKKAIHQKSIFYKTALGLGIVWFLPWPKGAPTAKEFLPGTGCAEPTVFEKDRILLLEAMGRFSEHGRQKDFEVSPVFGNLSRRAWGRLMWRHIDHHLRQFGA